VRDEQGAVIAGAAVTVKNSETGKTRNVSTDVEGRYSFTNLEPGSYELRVEVRGHKTALQSGLILAVGGAVTSDVALSVGAVTETVQIEAAEQLIEPNKVELSRVIDRQEIESLPNIGRNFVDFVKLSSGVAVGRENTAAGPFKEPDVGVGAVATPRLSFGGQNELTTLIMVDGVDNINTLTGLPRATPSQEAASEFRVLNSTYLAEYGRAMGGFVNIITRSGSNNARGSLYYFGMNDQLNARSILNTPDADVLRQHQYGATLGGPLKQDRTFYFLNYEGQARAESNRFPQFYRDILPALNAMRRRFNLTPETAGQVRTNDYNQFLTRLDHTIGQTALAVRYNFLNSETKNFLGVSGASNAASSVARNNETRDQALVFTAISSLSPRAANEARFQWARRSYEFPSILLEPNLEVTNLLNSGKSTADLDFYGEDRVQLTDSFGYSTGGHQLKAGGDYNYLDDRTGWAVFFPARVIFPALPLLLNFTPASTSGPALFWWPTLVNPRVTSYQLPVPFTRATPEAYGDGATDFQFQHSMYGLFAQDQWKVNDKLNLTYGLRYDFETYPSKYILDRDLNNFQPRVGLSYSWNSKGVVRAGFGLFHDRIASSVGQIFAAAEFSSRGNLPNARTLFPNQAAFAGRFQQAILGGPPATPATITFLTTGRTPATGGSGLNDSVASNLQNPYSTQASLQISQEIGGGVALTASYLYVHGLKLIGHTANLNAVQTGALATGKPSFAGGRRFADMGDNTMTTNLGGSIYHGGTLELQKRFNGGLGFHGSYTWSKVLTDVDSVLSSVDWPEAPGFRERSLARQHVEHRFTLSFLSQVPKSVPVLGDFKFSSLVSLESGRYYSLLVGSDANGDGNPFSDRPGRLGRNTLEGPGFATVDLRVARPVKFSERWSAEFSLDFFNLFNRTNIRDLNTTWGSIDLNAAPVATFKTPKNVFNPFQMQLGVKLKF
jgi:outer membrane receptor protein involved in Fe transport